MRETHLAEMRELEDHYWWFIARRRLAVSLLDDAGLSSPRLLDAGCGAGALLAELAARGEAFGLDAAGSAIAITAARGLRGLVRADVQELPFGSDLFDGVTLCDVLEHLDDDQQAVSEAGRVLRPGGVLIVTLPALRLLWGTHDEALGHRRRYQPRRLRAMLESAGLKTERMSFGLFFLFPVALGFRWAQRIMRRRHRPPETGIIRVPRFLNRLLIGLMDLENALIRRISLPVGVSLVAVARKPECGEPAQPAQ